MKIGASLKEILGAKGVPAERVREALGWDDETLRRVLSDELSPGISELLGLAAFLGVGISRLLNGTEATAQRAVKTGKNERVGVERKNSLHYESLAPSFAGRHLEPFVVELYRGREGEGEPSRHPGEEFLFVLEGELRAIVEGEEYRLEAGDSFYFYSSLPHALFSLSERTRLVAVLYPEASMLQLTRGHGMRSLIEAAKLLKGESIVLVSPDANSLRAVNRAMGEGILDKAYLVGNGRSIRDACGEEFALPEKYEIVETGEAPDAEAVAARLGVALVRDGKVGMLMKGAINTSVFMRAVLSKSDGIGTGRRLSDVSIFELPGVERLVFLTDPAINPELFPHRDAGSAADIIDNAVEVARALGVDRPRVALLEANEVPSEKIPTTLLEQALSKREWPLAEVYGPLSYDLALYPDAVEKKGLVGNPVAGRADILVVPHVSGGNFLYKSWVFTLGAEVANVVLGARVPLILTSRSDSDLTKFLTICAGALYSRHISTGKGARHGGDERAH